MSKGPKKQKPIAEIPTIYMVVLPADVRSLSFIEGKLAMESNRKRIEVPVAEIVRYAINRAYEVDRRGLSKELIDLISGIK